MVSKSNKPAKSQICGDGHVEPPEQCDAGAKTDDSCCSINCTWKPSGGPCGVRAGACYKKPRCDVNHNCIKAMKKNGSACKEGSIVGVCENKVCKPKKSTTAKKTTAKKTTAKKSHSRKKNCC